LYFKINKIQLFFVCLDELLRFFLVTNCEDKTVIIYIINSFKYKEAMKKWRKKIIRCW